MKKTPIVFQGARKALKMGSRNPPKIYKNASLDPKVSLFCAPRCPWIVAWSPRRPKWKHQACQMTGFGHKSDRICVQNDNYGLKK